MKKYIDHIENSRAQDAFSPRNINSLRQALIEEFNNECGYCRSKLGLTSKPQIDQFYPKSIYPEKAFQLDNLSCLAVCVMCVNPTSFLWTQVDCRFFSIREWRISKNI